MIFCLSGVICILINATCQVGIDSGSPALPALETFVTEPVDIENICIWIPAAKSGPFLNRSCHIQGNQVASFYLPASVKHQKTEDCPLQTARILAELTSFYHSQSLPLTIFNGWQWENTYNVCQHESISYNLAQRGGCWENSWEAILNLSCGLILLKQVDIESSEIFTIHKTISSESIIEVKTFSSLRTRDGYPKERQL